MNAVLPSFKFPIVVISFFALGQDAAWGLGNAEFIEEIPPFEKYYITFDKNDVIWGIGVTSDAAIEDALKNNIIFTKRQLKTCECTKEVYDDIEVNGYYHGDDEPYWEYDTITKMAYYPTKPARKLVFSQL